MKAHSATDSREWAAEIAEKSEVPVERVEEILREQRIPDARVLTSRSKMRIDAVHFAGVKHLRDESGDHEESTTFEPFSFTHEFSQPVTAFATRGMNDAGKSSIINVVTWGLRGRSGLQNDVQSWIHQAAVQVTIGKERVVVLWSNLGGVPRGQVLVLASANVGWDAFDTEALAFYTGAMTDTVEVEEAGDDGISVVPQTTLDPELSRLMAADAIMVASFVDEASFESSMASVMMPRLGFETIEAWQRNSNASEDDDGNLIDHGWMLWSQALSITDPSVKVTLGETAVSALPLLQMYLGTTWGPSATASQARIGAIKSDLASLLRRKRNTDEKLREGIAEIERQIAVVEAEIASAPLLATLEEIDDALVEAARNAAAAAEVNLVVQESGAKLGHLLKVIERAEAEEAAIAEAAITQRFWHSLKPSCCPRCDATVDEARWKREQEGSCSLCDSPVEIFAGDGSDVKAVAVMLADSEEDPDELQEIRDRIAALRHTMSGADQEYDAALELKKAADLRVASGRADPRLAGVDPRLRRVLDLQLATLRGRLEERRNQTVDDLELGGQEETLVVLEAALKVAKKKRDEEQNEMLADVSARITTMGQALGIKQLESAKLQGNTHLPVVKGGAKSAFGTLTDGEKLRLKIALVIALLHVGTAAGVGRHPGVLLIDSLAREELNPNNAKTLLEELSKVAEENDLQIITSSAHGELVESALPPGATRLSNDDGLMW